MQIMHLIRHHLFALSVAVLLFRPTIAGAQSVENLTPVQREALAPLSKEWNTLQIQQQQRLINLAKRYPQLDAVQKQRLHNRLEKWSKLTPEQRNRAREKFQAFSKAPLEKREQVKQMVRQQEAEKLSMPAANPALTNTP